MSELKRDPLRINDEPWNCQHFNSNRAAGIAIKTTGPNPRVHELVQICVFPLNTKLELAKETIPFYCDLKPLKPAINLELGKGLISREKYEEIRENAQMPQVIADLFDEWMESKIKPAVGKKILPLAYNWSYIKPFIKKWLGPIRFNEYFSEEYRDIMCLSLYQNDRADQHGFQIPYPKVHLSFLANILKVEYLRLDDTILHVLSITEIYKKIMNEELPLIKDLPK